MCGPGCEDAGKITVGRVRSDTSCSPADQEHTPRSSKKSSRASSKDSLTYKERDKVMEDMMRQVLLEWYDEHTAAQLSADDEDNGIFAGFEWNADGTFNKYGGA